MRFNICESVRTLRPFKFLKPKSAVPREVLWLTLLAKVSHCSCKVESFRKVEHQVFWQPMHRLCTHDVNILLADDRVCFDHDKQEHEQVVKNGEYRPHVTPDLTLASIKLHTETSAEMVQLEQPLVDEPLLVVSGDSG